MKTFVMMAALLFSGMPALAADAGNEKAEQEIKARAKEFEAAWLKHDAKVLAEFYARDADLVTAAGQTHSGRSDIEDMFQGAFDNSLKDTTFSWSVEKVRLIRPDVAIVDYEAEIKPPDANAEPYKFHVVSVLTRQDGKWLTETSRGIKYSDQ